MWHGCAGLSRNSDGKQGQAVCGTLPVSLFPHPETRESEVGVQARGRLRRASPPLPACARGGRGRERGKVRGKSGMASPWVGKDAAACPRLHRLIWRRLLARGRL